MSEQRKPQVALISMPWMQANMPSIQLATVAHAAQQSGIECDKYEFFVDFATRIGIPLYRRLCEHEGFTSEWLFARHSYGPEQGSTLDSFIEARKCYFQADYISDEVLELLEPVTADFLLQCL